MKLVAILNSESPSLSLNTEASREYNVQQYRLGQSVKRLDAVAEEVPIAFVYNGVSHAVMLATPQDLEDFALGFSLSEGIIESPSDLYGLEIHPLENGIELQLEIASACFLQLKEKRRNLTGRTGCGLCGSESLNQALRMPTEAQLNTLKAVRSMSVSAEILSLAYNNIRAQQLLQASTGATHASAFVDLSGNILLLREDVGRHNALDKLVGALKKQVGMRAGFILTTSRASYEMVQKTISAGVPMLVAISAPTGLAIRVAAQYGITLVGFAREHSFVVYNDTKKYIELN